MRRLAIWVVAALPLGAAPPSTFDSAIRPFLKQNCLGCHNAKAKVADLVLDQAQSMDDVLRDRARWERVAEKIRSGEMPPRPMKRPSASDVHKIVAAFDGAFDAADRKAGPDPGRITARRLNRVEYNNTIRDLLAVDFQPANDFPVDDSGYGFDNIGDVLTLSPVLMDQYLKAAEEIAARAAGTARPSRPTLDRYRAERLKRPKPTVILARATVAEKAEYEIRTLIGGYREGATAMVDLTVSVDGAPVKTFYVDPRLDRQRDFNLRLALMPGTHTLHAEFTKDPLPGTKSRDINLSGFEIRGPYPIPGPSPSRQLLFVCAGQTPDCARRIIGGFARRAFRRPVTAQEVDRLLRFYEQARAEGQSHDHGIQLAVTAVLVSPHFLFRVEKDPPAGAARAVSDVELATRLSYFLWSSTPDEELLSLAERSQLRPRLNAQIRRMLADPRARALPSNFAGQWLQVRNLDSVKPDPDRFPQFDDELRAAMRQETELYFEAILRESRPLLEFLDSDYTFLNERLARHYGVPNVAGEQFRRVTLADRRRGGVLTHASVLTVSSYPNRTSPVIRGKWVLENLLNTPPPPPPPNVPSLDEASIGTKGSLRQQFEQHRANAICASCHNRMDALGFALENFDAIGRWRERDGNFPIDASGTLPSGQSFNGPAELKAVLKSEEAQAFRLALADRMLTFALGRGLERSDRLTLKDIAARVERRGDTLTALVEEIVNSLPFQKRRGERPPEPGKESGS
ncbi:MAG: DUF1592 domain-containing protein [Bryobacter sp.]|nr:DUF1592 domain-containing protein [Bryobacter sp.]